MFNTLRATLVVGGIFGLVAAPFVIVMLILLATGASSGAIIGFGFLVLTVTLLFAFSKRGQAMLGPILRKAARRS